MAVILRTKILSVILAGIFALTPLALSGAGDVMANDGFIRFTSWKEKYEFMWNNATDEERFFLPTEVKAYACGLSTSDFIFFARVVEGEGLDDGDDITDKVLIACSVLNRINCKKWPTKTVITTLKRPGQFLVVNRDTGECNCARSLDSEWAIVEAYRLVATKSVDCHMVYYNSIGFTGYSRYFTDYAFFGGNYFSVLDCDCDYCKEWDPDWKEEDVEMLTDDFRIKRPVDDGKDHFV